MLIGYARVSTLEQSLDLQTDSLKRAGCDKIFTDKAGGARAERPGLDQALAHLRKGDTLGAKGQKDIHNRVRFASASERSQSLERDGCEETLAQHS
jgi:Resolvase, N terminal domain